jgi:hypothetical protein
MAGKHNPAGWPRRSRLLPYAALLIAAASLAAACAHQIPAGNGADARPAARLAIAEPGAPAASAHRLALVSASFTSPSKGWLLAVPPCALNTKPCRTLLLRSTTDGGTTWADKPAPDAPFATPGSGGDAVGSILFTSSRDGWAFGPGLWQTRDGGATGPRVSIPGGPVLAMAAGDGRVLAATGRCTASGQDCWFGVYTSRTGSTTWRPVAAATARGAGSPALFVSGHTGYLAINVPLHGRTVLLAGPVTGSARWRPLRNNPCMRPSSMAVAAAAGGRLFIGCGSEPGAGQQMKTAYLSGDYGRTWRRVANPPSGGYIGSASMTRGGTIFLSGGRMDIYVSRNRGRSWQVSQSLNSAASQAGAGFDLLAVATGNTTGYATQRGVYRQQLWLTGDGGRRWTPVTVR